MYACMCFIINMLRDVAWTDALTWKWRLVPRGRIRLPLPPVIPNEPNPIFGHFPPPAWPRRPSSRGPGMPGPYNA